MRPGLVVFAALSSALPAYGVESTLVQAGFTGLGITPSARVLQWGKAELGYDNQLAGVFNRTEGHNYVVGFGLLPNLEVAARLATNELSSNCFSLSGCGTRDLSGSVKFGLPLDRQGRWSAAVGATDLGGSVTYFRSYYGVLTYQSETIEASGGLSARSGPGSNRGSRSPLDGPFASLAWQPARAVRAHVEYADGNAWAGIRLFAPAEWLPQGWTLSAGFNQTLTDTNLTQRQWWSAGLSIPLYKTPSRPASIGDAARARPAVALAPVAPATAVVTPVTNNAASGDGPTIAPAATAPAPAMPPQAASVTAEATSAPTAPATDDQLRDLAKALEAKGLDDIWIGRLPGGAVAIRADNAVHAHNAVDALGAALGTVARSLGGLRSSFRLILTQRQVPLVAVSGRADCLRDWLANGANTCTAGQLSTPASAPFEPLHAGANWVVQAYKPAWSTLRVAVTPALRTAVGTDFGALDYSLAANVSVRLPVWRGGSLEWAGNAPVANTSDYDRDGFFGSRRVPSGTERLAVSHAMAVPIDRVFGPRSGALLGQLTLGRVGTYYDGALVNLRWESTEGTHRVSWTGGSLRNNSFDSGRGPLGTLRTAEPALASYRFSFMPTRTDVEITGGRFLWNDTGVQLGMRQWFSDVSVGLFYKRTAFDGQPNRQLAGIEVSVPFGPRQDWRPHPNLLVGGGRFTHGIETSIREARGGNPLRVGHGQRLTQPDFDGLTNADRTGLAYFEDNLPRIREAANR
jgi:hypothetical protein